MRGNCDANREAREFFEAQAAELPTGRLHAKRNVERTVIYPGKHLVGGKVVQRDLDSRCFAMEATQCSGKDLHRERRGIADSQLAPVPVRSRTYRRDRLLGSPENRARFSEKKPPRSSQPQRFGATLEMYDAELFLEIMDLTTDRRLRNVKLRCGANDILRFGDSDEVAEMSEFHASEHAFPAC